MKQVLVAVAFLMFALSGCTSESSEEMSPPPTSFGAAGAEKAAQERLAGGVATSGSSDLDMMVEAYRNGGVSFPRNRAEEYAEITCDTVRDGLSPTRVADMWSEEVTDYSVSDHYVLTGAAIGAYCPEEMGLDGF